MYEPVFEHGGASAMIQQATDVLHDTYLKQGKDFPLVVIPER